MMADLISLCTDVIMDSEKPDDPVLLDCLTGLQNHKVFRHADDDGLKFGLKCINQLLNETKTRTKGLMLLDNFVAQVDPSRLVGFQDSLQSTLILLSKCLDLDLTHKVLVKLLPMCHQIPELIQLISSTIIPKFFAHFNDNPTSSLTNDEELALLVALLKRYRGPCGQYRQQIEKIIIPTIDLHYQDEIAKLFPLLSATGGGGTKGDKYSQDWSDTVTKILNALYDTLVNLLEDVCPHFDSENPYIIERDQVLQLPNIRYSNVLNRISAMNRRLINLTRILTSFICEPFPAPKSVPMRGILNLLANMTMVNPLSLLKSKNSEDGDAVIPRENVYLASMLPSIHLAAIELLDKLILSCGCQLFPDASRLELLLLQEFKWVVEKPNSFENLKTQLYKTLKSWLTITNGSISSNKNATVLMQQIIQDVRIDKQSVSLSLGVKSKKGKKKQNKQSRNLNASKTVDVKEVDKSDVVCTAALECLLVLIPSLDFASHRAAYLTLATTVGDFTGSSEYPSPYNVSECRCLALKCLVQLAVNPHQKSPVSLGLITCLVELGTKDDNHNVTKECHKMLSLIERIIHPSCATFQFPSINVPLHSEAMQEQGLVLDESTDNKKDDEEEQAVSTINTFCQTDATQIVDEHVNSSMEEHSIANVSSSSITMDANVIKDYVAHAVKENLNELLNRKTRKQLSFDSDDDDCVIVDSDSSSNNHTKAHIPSNDFKHHKSHLALVKDIEEKEIETVEPLCKRVKTWTTGNGISTTTGKELDDGVSVTVEEILLNFDDNIVLMEG